MYFKGLLKLSIKTFAALLECVIGIYKHEFTNRKTAKDTAFFATAVGEPTTSNKALEGDHAKTGRQLQALNINL